MHHRRTNRVEKISQKSTIKDFYSLQINSWTRNHRKKNHFDVDYARQREKYLPTISFRQAKRFRHSDTLIASRHPIPMIWSPGDRQFDATILPVVVIPVSSTPPRLTLRSMRPALRNSCRPATPSLEREDDFGLVAPSDTSEKGKMYVISGSKLIRFAFARFSFFKNQSFSEKLATQIRE